MLRLEGTPNEAPFARGRASLRTASGSDVWQGPAVSDRASPLTLARIELPAKLLGPEDYIVHLVETEPSGQEKERYRYFLRVRAK
jgi:hypothetical protein